MWDRRGLAILILTAWAAALGWQVRRVFFPSEVERLAAGVRTLPPGVAYYSVYRGTQRAGWAQTDIDTLPNGTGFRVRDRLYLEMPGLGSAATVERSTDEYLDRELDLDSLVRVNVAGADTTLLRAVVEGDTLLRIAGAGDRLEAVDLPGPVTTDVGWRLRLAASGAAGAGALYGLDLFDPGSGTRRSLRIEILESSALSFPDSADTDSLSGAWIAVRRDTVNAWRVRQRVGGATFESWVDEDGRLVDGDIVGGFRMERTAFELAFFTRPGAAEAGRSGGDPDTPSRGFE